MKRALVINHWKVSTYHLIRRLCAHHFISELIEILWLTQRISKWLKLSVQISKSIVCLFFFYSQKRSLNLNGVSHRTNECVCFFYTQPKANIWRMTQKVSIRRKLSGEGKHIVFMHSFVCASEWRVGGKESNYMRSTTFAWSEWHFIIFLSISGTVSKFTCTNKREKHTKRSIFVCINNVFTKAKKWRRRNGKPAKAQQIGQIEVKCECILAVRTNTQRNGH